MIHLTEDKRVLGWESPTRQELTAVGAITMDNQFDKFHRPNWLWEFYPDGSPVYEPLPYTLDQGNELRKKWCKAEIEKLYPQDVQFKIMMEKDDRPEAYVQMQADRIRIKAESKKKDFQIEGDI